VREQSTGLFFIKMEREGKKMQKDNISNSFKLGKTARVIREAFYERGYSEIFLPTIDRYSGRLREGLKTAVNNEFYVIRPDVTSHLLANRINDDELKIFYVSEVLKGSVEGQWQIGAEWIGGEPGRASRIGEMIDLIGTILNKLALTDFSIDIGSIKAWENLISGDFAQREQIFEAIKTRSFSAIEKLSLPVQIREKLLKNLRTRGSVSDDPTIRSVIESRQDRNIIVDLGTIRLFDYYDDIVIEIYTKNHSRAIGGGGEYINQGQQCFGFALDLEALADLSRESDDKGRDNND